MNANNICMQYSNAVTHPPGSRRLIQDLLVQSAYSVVFGCLFGEPFTAKNQFHLKINMECIIETINVLMEYLIN